MKHDQTLLDISCPLYTSSCQLSHDVVNDPSSGIHLVSPSLRCSLQNHVTHIAWQQALFCPMQNPQTPESRPFFQRAVRFLQAVPESDVEKRNHQLLHPPGEMHEDARRASNKKAPSPEVVQDDIHKDQNPGGHITIECWQGRATGNLIGETCNNRQLLVLSSNKNFLIIHTAPTRRTTTAGNLLLHSLHDLGCTRVRRNRRRNLV